MYLRRFKCQGIYALPQNFNTAMLDFIKFDLFRNIPTFLQDTKHSTQKFGIGPVIRRRHVKSFFSYYIIPKIYDTIHPLQEHII